MVAPGRLAWHPVAAAVAGHGSTPCPTDHPSHAARPCGRPAYGVDAALMLFQRHERGIHIV
jgi:hypothetical protein